MYRHKDGRFKPKHQHKLECKVRLYMTLSFLTFALALGFALQPYEIEIHRTIAEAVEVTAEVAPYPNDVCELATVQCGTMDERVQNAIDAVSEALGHQVQPETEKRIAYLYEKSVENYVPFEDAVATIYCESMWMSQQSNAYYKDGQQELSFGLSQIHLPSHPNITKEQALDAYFSIDFLIANWYSKQAVEDKMWFGFSRTAHDCTNGLHIEI